MTTDRNGPLLQSSRDHLVPPATPRGSFTIPLPGSVWGADAAAKVSFVSYSLVPGYRLAYHDADVISVREGRAIVFVGPHDVVTRERL